MFDEIIEGMQNRKHYLLIFAILSTVYYKYIYSN